MPAAYLSPTLEKLQAGLPNYLQEARVRTTEESKKILFAGFLQDVFGVTIQDFSRLMERFVESKALVVKGHVDAVFGNLIIEFKRNLHSGLDDARQELVKYLQSMREEFPTQSYLGLATDGLAFLVFKPTVNDTGTVSGLKQIDSLNLESQEDPKTIYLWFDSYLFSSKQIAPSTEDLKRRFGVESPTFYFIQEELLLLLTYLKEEPSVKLKLSSWSRYLEIAYGTSLGTSELFAKHTYLATLAKLVIFERLEQGRIPTRQELPDILNGAIFRNAGITNLVDEDFFTWILHPRVAHRVTNLVVALLKELQTYDLTQITEDVFKELYQELVDPDVRHDLGEYYTPDWIAHYIVNKLLDENPNRSILDPSCGSGTFLFLFLREAKARLKRQSKPEVLQHLLDNTAGIDIHPLAVIISRTNFLLAIQDLLDARSGPITIPVYLSDSIRLPPTTTDIQLNTRYYKIAVDGSRFFALPVRIVRQRWILDQLAQRMFESAKDYETQRAPREGILSAFRTSLTDIWSFAAEETELIEQDMTLLLDLIDANTNSIWTFIIRNMYQPLSLSTRKFDTVVGNPPWLVMRQMSNPDYQRFLKEDTRRFGLLDNKQTHLFPHMEIATVFWCECASSYLREGGTIAFVLPRSVLVSQHHSRFLTFANPPTSIELILDFDGVRPHKIVFNVPACAIFGRFIEGAKTIFPVPVETFRGTLERRNSSLEEALALLVVARDRFLPRQVAVPPTTSPYADKFFQGATIVPRSFWFPQFLSHPTLGIDPRRPRAQSDPKLEQKKPWIGARIIGNVEADYIFATLLSSDLVPFAFTSLRAVILPLKVGPRLGMLSSYSEALASGQNGLANWLSEAERLWQQRATAKSKRAGMYEWLNYRHKITNQDPRAKFKVLYTASATDLTACAIDLAKPLEIHLDGTQILARAFVAESKTYWFDTQEEGEAMYLVAILNSNPVNQAIKSSQTRGLWGPRDIHKRPLSIPFPQFDPSRADHALLSDLGKRGQEKAQAAIPAALAFKSLARRRRLVREAASAEILEIDQIIQRVLQS